MFCSGAVSFHTLPRHGPRSLPPLHSWTFVPLGVPVHYSTSDGSLGMGLGRPLHSMALLPLPAPSIPLVDTRSIPLALAPLPSGHRALAPLRSTGQSPSLGMGLGRLRLASRACGAVTSPSASWTLRCVDSSRPCAHPWGRCSPSSPLGVLEVRASCCHVTLALHWTFRSRVSASPAPRTGGPSVFSLSPGVSHCVHCLH